MLPNYHGPDRAGVGWRALAVDNDTPFKRLFSFLRIKPLRSRAGVFVVLGILSLFWFITVQFGPPSFFTDTFPPPPPPPPIPPIPIPFPSCGESGVTGLNPLLVLAVLGCGLGVIGLKFVGLVTDKFEIFRDNVDVGVGARRQRAGRACVVCGYVWGTELTSAFYPQRLASGTGAHARARSAGTHRSGRGTGGGWGSPRRRCRERGPAEGGGGGDAGA